jgi:mevalonate kinase
MRIFCPSKTFLIGEYAVLSGNPAILFATPPCFSWDIEGFYDPYEGLGGFGASGAEFVIAAKRQGMVDVWKVLESYKKQGFAGSGADVVAQWQGGMTYFYARNNIIESISWPFEDLVVGLIHTGYKIKTHEHLEKLNLDKLDLSSLEKIVLDCYENLKNKNQNLFLKTIVDYAQELDRLGLVSDTTKLLLNKFTQHNPNNIILGYKGCGAMGADVVLVIIEKQNKALFEKYCETENLNLVYCDNQFAEGARQYD